jgi:thioredoxin-dependent peroxiredoxin
MGCGFPLFQTSTRMIARAVLPDFELPATGNQAFRLSAFRGHPFVIYFYPKDDTPGCTTEGTDFRDLYPQFVKEKVSVFGVSRDSIASHERFKAKFAFPFELLSDPGEKACAIFDVVKVKNMYGRPVRGIERSTFVVDREGRIAREWRGVKVPGHAQEVLDFLRSADL